MLSKALAATVNGRRISRRKFGWSNGRQMFHSVAQPACTTPALFVEPSRSAVLIVSLHCSITRTRAYHTKNINATINGAVLALKFWEGTGNVPSAPSSLSQFYPFSETVKKYKLHIGLHLPASFWIWGQQVNLGARAPPAQRRTTPDDKLVLRLLFQRNPDETRFGIGISHSLTSISFLLSLARTTLPISALTLLVGQQERHLAVTSPAQTIPKLSWNNSRKIVRLYKITKIKSRSSNGIINTKWYTCNHKPNQPIN